MHVCGGAWAAVAAPGAHRRPGTPAARGGVAGGGGWLGAGVRSSTAAPRPRRACWASSFIM
jgi:hypothetical protein